jgi:hypothetical protein
MANNGIFHRPAGHGQHTHVYNRPNNNGMHTMGSIARVWSVHLLLALGDAERYTDGV